MIQRGEQGGVNRTALRQQRGESGVNRDVRDQKRGVDGVNRLVFGGSPLGVKMTGYVDPNYMKSEVVNGAWVGTWSSKNYGENISYVGLGVFPVANFPLPVTITADFQASALYTINARIFSFVGIGYACGSYATCAWSAETTNKGVARQKVTVTVPVTSEKVDFVGVVLRGVVEEGGSSAVVTRPTVTVYTIAVNGIDYPIPDNIPVM